MVDLLLHYIYVKLTFVFGCKFCLPERFWLFLPCLLGSLIALPKTSLPVADGCAQVALSAPDISQHSTS